MERYQTFARALQAYPIQAFGAVLILTVFATCCVAQKSEVMASKKVTTATATAGADSAAKHQTEQKPQRPINAAAIGLYPWQRVEEEIAALRNDIARLESLVLELQQGQVYSPSSHAWACYINDRRAGGVVATGASKVEATGKALERCSDRKGYCRLSDVVCGHPSDKK